MTSVVLKIFDLCQDNRKPLLIKFRHNDCNVETARKSIKFGRDVLVFRHIIMMFSSLYRMLAPYRQSVLYDSICDFD